MVTAGIKSLQGVLHVAVRVKPRASRSRVLGFRGGALEVQVAAPPVAGEANRELLATLSRALGIRRSAISLVKGQTGRNKWIQLEGLTEEALVAKVCAGVSK